MFLTTTAAAMSSQEQPSRLLALPDELLQSILKIIRRDLEQQRNIKWFKKPANELIALRLTCKQLQNATSATTGQQLISYHRLGKFTESFPIEPHTRQSYLMSSCRSLTIQFPFDAPPHKHNLLAKVLSNCRESLQELHLSFTGIDRYGNQTYIHGCAFASDSDRKPQLRRDGQMDMLTLIFAIRSLTRLRVLVISNINAQLFGSVFTHMPRLEYLHLTADPRSVVHRKLDLNRYGILLATPRRYPPVRVMHLCANSLMNAFSLPSYCAATLTHLTWTIPDVSYDSITVGASPYQSTFQLLLNLGLNARRLKTLRICVDGFGDSAPLQDQHALLAALTRGIAQLRGLESFELHLDAAAPFHLGREILLNLPTRIKRFYTSDKLVKPRELYRFLTEEYLSATLPGPHPPRPGPEEETLARWAPQLLPTPPLTDHWSEYHESDIKMWILPTSYRPTHIDEGEQTAGVEIVRRSGVQKSQKRDCTGVADSALFLPGIIGEDHSRRDYIPLRGGDLKFVAYEFSDPEYKCRTASVGETTTQMVLRLNGRLLDRDRNRHLAWYALGMPTPPRTMSEELPQLYGAEQAFDSPDADICTLLLSAYSIELDEPRDYKAAIEELAASPLTDDDRYFGREDEAARVFARESVARPEDLPELRCAYYEDWERNDQCHWMCPEADVPSLTQLNQLDAQKRRARANEKNK